MDWGTVENFSVVTLIWRWRCIRAYGTGNLHIKTAPSMLKVIYRGNHAYSSKTTLHHILHLLQHHGFVVEESRCWTGLPAAQNCHQLKTFGVSWNYMMKKIWRRRSRLLSCLNPVSCNQEWGNIPFSKVQQLVSSVPRCLGAVVIR